MVATREKLYRLVDALPDSELHGAEGYLEYLATVGGDPVRRAVATAPYDDEPLTDEDWPAPSRARADVAAARCHARKPAGGCWAPHDPACQVEW